MKNLTIIGAMIVCGCAQDDSPAQMNNTATERAQATAPSIPETIGSAQMGREGTITLYLSLDQQIGGKNAVGDAVAVYPKDHPQYRYILKHVGPLKPGGSVSVRPFPDE